MKLSRIMLAATLLAASTTQSRVFLPETMSEFYEIIEEYPFAVVHLIDYDPQNIPRETRSMKSSLRDLSRTKEFEQSGVAFVGINVRDLPDMQRIEMMDNHSVLFIYDHGYVIKDEQGADAHLDGSPHEEDIEKFLDDHLRSRINDQVTDYGRMRPPADQGPQVVVQNPGYKTWYAGESPYSGYSPWGHIGWNSDYHRYDYNGDGYWGAYYPSYYRHWWWQPTIGYGAGFNGRYGGINFSVGF